MKKMLKNFGNIFKKFGESVVKGDIWVKLSLLIMGAGYMGRGQVIKGILMTIVEAVFVLYMAVVGVPYLSKFGTLGTVQFEKVFNVSLDTLRHFISVFILRELIIFLLCFFLFLLKENGYRKQINIDRR